MADRIFRYRVTWAGPFDGKDRPPRILRLAARNKADAAKLHSRLFPVSTRTIERIRKEVA